MTSRPQKNLTERLRDLRKLDNSRNHLLITGGVKKGKTTLLRSYIKEFYRDEEIDGFVTDKIGNKVYISNYERTYLDNKVRYEHVIAGLGPEVKFDSSLFLSIAKASFKRYNSNIFLIDEVGRFELAINGYADILIDVFNRARVFAVIKKVSNPISSRLDEIGDYALYDLDQN